MTAREDLPGGTLPRARRACLALWVALASVALLEPGARATSPDREQTELDDGPPPMRALPDLGPVELVRANGSVWLHRGHWGPCCMMAGGPDYRLSPEDARVLEPLVASATKDWATRDGPMILVEFAPDTPVVRTGRTQVTSQGFLHGEVYELTSARIEHAEILSTAWFAARRRALRALDDLGESDATNEGADRWRRQEETAARMVRDLVAMLATEESPGRVAALRGIEPPVPLARQTSRSIAESLAGSLHRRARSLLIEAWEWSERRPEDERCPTLELLVEAASGEDLIEALLERCVEGAGAPAPSRPAPATPTPKP